MKKMPAGVFPPPPLIGVKLLKDVMAEKQITSGSYIYTVGQVASLLLLFSHWKLFPFFETNLYQIILVKIGLYLKY